MKNYKSSGKTSILLDLLSDPALIVDEKWVFLNVNSAFEEVTGLNGKELIGSHFSELNILTAEMKAALSEIQKKRMRGEPNEPYEVCFTGKAGETHYAEVRERKISYSGQPAYLNVLRDITRRKENARRIKEYSVQMEKLVEEKVKEIRDAEEKYRNLFENAPDVIVTFNLSGKITSANKAIMQHGFRENEIVGNSIFKLVPIEYKQKMLTDFKSIAAGNQAQGEIEIVTPNGKRSAEYNSNPLWLNGKVVGSQTIIRDVTERKKAEEASVKTRALLDSIVSSTKDLIWAVSLDEGFPLISYNKALADYFMKTQNLQIKAGMTVKEIMPNEQLEQRWIELNQKALEKGTLTTEYVTLIDPRIFDLTLNVLKNGEKPYAIAAFAKDVTGRKKAEESLEKEQQELNSIIESSPINIFYKDKEGKFVRVNEACAKALKIPKEKFFGKTVFDLYSPETARGMARDDLEVLQTGRPKLGILEQCKSASAVRWVQTDKVPIFDKNGVSTGLIGFAQDITERKKAEEALRESEEKHRRLFEESIDAIFMADPVTGIIVDCNPAASKLVGRKKSELVGQHQSILHPKERIEGNFERSFKQHLKDPTKILETQIVRKTGEIRDVAISGVIVEVNGKKLIQGIFRDITDCKNAEEALLAAGEKFKTIFENVHDVITYVDTHGKILDVNGRVEELVGYKREEIIGKNFVKLGLIQFGDIPKLLKLFFWSMRKGEEQKIVQLEFKHKNGSKVSVEVGTRFIRDKRGKIVGIVNIYRDVTENKKAELAIAESEAKYRKLVENSREGIVISQDSPLRFVFVNSELGKILGYSPEQLLVLSPEEIMHLIHPDDRKTFFDRLKKRSKGKTTESTYEFRVIRKNGSIGWVEGRSSFIEFTGLPAVQSIFLDITERKKAEEQVKNLQNLFQLQVDRMPIGLIVWDTEFHVKTWNPSATRIFGFTQQEAVGKHPYELIVPKQAQPQIDKIWSRLLHGDITANSVNQNLTKDGRIIICDWANTPLREKDGTIIGVLSMVQDITDREKAEEARKQAEYKLFQAEKRYHALFNDAPLGVLVIDPQTAKPVEFNDVAYTQLGYSKEEFSKLRISDFEAKEKADEISTHIARILREGVDEFETEHRTKNGEVRNVLVNAKVVELAGKPFLHSIFHDITEIRKMQKALMESEAGYRQLVELAQEGIWTVDNNFNTVFVNSHMAQMLGCTESEMIGKNILDFLFKADIEKTKLYLSQFKQGMNGNFEHEFRRKDGSSVKTSIAAAQIKDDEGNYIGTLALVSDITLRKKAEDELKQEKERLETITESIGVGLTITNKDYRILWTNEVMKQLRGIPDLEGRTCYATYNYLDTVCPECGVKKVFEGKESDSREYMVFDREKGSAVWMQLIATPIKDKDGNVTSALELVLPITERKKTELSLKNSEEKFRNLAEKSPNIIFINQKGKVVYANREAEEATGYTKEEFYSPEFNFMDLITPESKELVKSQFTKHMRGEDVDPYEYRLISRKGRTIDVINNSKLIDYNGEPAILGIETDITESKKLKEKLEQYSVHLEDLVKEKTVQLEQAQAQLVKSERLAAIGELAGMVGHDLRNPLTGIRNAAYYLKKKGTACSDGQAKEMLEIIDKAIDHSNKIINDLLDYSRDMHLNLTECIPRKLLDEAVRMIQVPARIQIVNHVFKETSVRVDEDKMMRVFINLIKNAIDAMPMQGTLEITSRQTGENVEIAFADTGLGIPDEILPKIFSPLFTTKAQGMGFGLAICKRIVEAHGGTITVKTALDKGTVFTVTLPIKPELEVGGEKTWINMPESLLSTTTRA